MASLDSGMVGILLDFLFCLDLFELVIIYLLFFFSSLFSFFFFSWR